MSRKSARVIAMKLLYQQELHGENDPSQIERGLEIINEPPNEDDAAYISDVTLGVWNNREIIDGVIRQCILNWSIERLSKVDLCILRTAIYELLYRDDIPPSVTANEAVDIASKYGTEDSYSYINGVIRKAISVCEDLKKERGN